MEPPTDKSTATHSLGGSAAAGDGRAAYSSTVAVSLSEAAAAAAALTRPEGPGGPRDAAGDKVRSIGDVAPSSKNALQPSPVSATSESLL